MYDKANHRSFREGRDCVNLDLTDPELLDLILGRSEPEGEATSGAARQVLESLRCC